MDIENKTFTVIDFESTGGSYEKDRILEIGACRIKNGEVAEYYSEYVYSEVPSSPFAMKVHRIPAHVTNAAGPIEEALDRLTEFIGDSILVAHNAKYDMNMLRAALARKSGDPNYRFPYEYICTVQCFRALRKLKGIETKNDKLDTLCEYFGIRQENYHSAGEDALVTAKAFLKIYEADPEAIQVSTMVQQMTLPVAEDSPPKKKIDEKPAPARPISAENSDLPLYENGWKDIPRHFRTKTMLYKDGITDLPEPAARVKTEHGIFFLYDVRREHGDMSWFNEEDVQKRAAEYFAIAWQHKKEKGDAEAEEKGWLWLRETFGVEGPKRDFFDLDKETCVRIVMKLTPSVEKIRSMESDQRRMA